jgi:citrate synthase
MPNMHEWTTGISKIVSDGKDEDLIIYGHRLTKLIGQKSFVEATYLMLTGRLPTPGQATTLDALMTAAIDHALTAAAMIPRSFASYGTSTTAALAAGILLFGNIAGGAGEPLARDIVDRVAAVQAVKGGVSDEDLRGVARSMVREAEGKGERVPGFGIPVHKADPRAPVGLQVARDNGVFDVYCRLLVFLEEERVRDPVSLNHLDALRALREPGRAGGGAR